MSTVDVYIYYLAQIEIFESWLNWGEAFLQNMVGNIISFNNLFTKMAIATENEDQKLVWFIWGRLSYKTLDFEPIDDEFMPIEESSLINVSILDKVV
jgi:hypothetical protein